MQNLCGFAITETLFFVLKKESKLLLPPTKWFRFGNTFVHFKGNISWSNLPSSVKNSQAVNEFELKLRIWETFTVHPLCIIETCSFKFLTFRYVYFPSIYLIVVKFSIG